MNDLEDRYGQLVENFTDQIVVEPCLRVNTLRKCHELIKRLQSKEVQLTKVPFLKHGYWYKSEFSLGATTEYLQGYYYLQEAASQIAVELLAPKETDTVLDMAAAPGGKTTQMAQHMNNKGVLVALDSNNYRLRSLISNLERTNVKNCVVYRKDARFASDLGIEFNKILLDAPCSGNFAIEENFFDKHSLKTVKQISKTQKELLKSAIKCLKPGGTIMYSTCSLEPEENEMNINWILNKYDNVKLEKIDSIGSEGLVKPFDNELDSSISKCRRLWPHLTKTQGFFLAKLKKVED